MGKFRVIFLAIVSVIVSGAWASQITIENSAYQNIVIEISENVPTANCREILEELEVSRPSNI